MCHSCYKRNLKVSPECMPEARWSKWSILQPRRSCHRAQPLQTHSDLGRTDSAKCLSGPGGGHSGNMTSPSPERQGGRQMEKDGRVWSIRTLLFCDSHRYNSKIPEQKRKGRLVLLHYDFSMKWWIFLDADVQSARDTSYLQCPEVNAGGSGTPFHLLHQHGGYKMQHAHVAKVRIYVFTSYSFLLPTHNQQGGMMGFI